MRTMLKDGLQLDPIVVDALLADETRPRSVGIGHGLLVILRGVNLNPGAQLEDMVSLRLWFESDLIVTSRARMVMAVNDVRDALAAGRGPTGPGDFLQQVAERLIERMGPVIDDLEEGMDDLERTLLDEERTQMRVEISRIRRVAVMLRRHLAPQREATSRLQNEDFTWLDTRQRAGLRELTDRTLRYVEELDSVRERAALLHEELMNRLSEQMNRNMYVLSVIAAILLPLGFVTGLLGINVGGMPGAESDWAFAKVTVGLIVFAIVIAWLFRRKGWI